MANCDSHVCGILARTEVVVGSRSCKVVVNRSTNICKAEQRLHAVAPSTRGYNDCGTMYGILEDMFSESGSIDLYLIDLNLQIYQPSLKDLEVWLPRSEDQ